MTRHILGAAVLAAALAGLAAPAPARAHGEVEKGKHLSCDIGTDYSIRPYRSAFLFTREAPAREVGIGGGRLFVDGAEVKLSAADQARVRDMERELHALVPEVQKLAVEAVDIAFTALAEVARALSADPGQTVASLEASRRKVRAEMNRKPMAVFDEDAMADVVQPLLREYLPEIISGAVRTAIKAAFATGKEAGELQARMERMERELDQRVDSRAHGLEPLARSLCARMRRIDALDDALEARGADGAAYDLFRVDRKSGEPDA